MKKIILPLCAISLMLFSCASNSSLPQKDSAPEEATSESSLSEESDAETEGSLNEADTSEEVASEEVASEEVASEEVASADEAEAPSEQEDEIPNLEEISADEGEFITEPEVIPQPAPELTKKEPDIPDVDIEIPLIAPAPRETPAVALHEENEGAQTETAEAPTDGAETYAPTDGENTPQDDDSGFFSGVDINPTGETLAMVEPEPAPNPTVPQDRTDFSQKETAPKGNASSANRQSQQNRQNQQPRQSQQNGQSRQSRQNQTNTPSPQTTQPAQDENPVQAQTEESSADDNAAPLSLEQIVPSRNVEMKNNQYLDIVYPGSGWVYLGEVDGTEKLRYFGRKIGSGDTTFSLRSREEGDTTLHFYKNDALTGEYIDDYLSVKIRGRATDSSRAKAPLYAEVVPPRPPKKTTASSQQAQSTESALASEKENAGGKNTQEKTSAESTAAQNASSPTASSSVQATAAATASSAESASSTAHGAQQRNYDEGGTNTVISNTSTQSQQKEQVPNARTQEDSVSESAGRNSSKQTENVSIQDTSNLSEDEILALAQECYDNGEYSKTLAYLNAFFEKSVSRTDEGLYLQGQTYESNSSVRNIRSALDTYETIVRRYPHSIHWAKANERIIYLRRFYINIR